MKRLLILFVASVLLSASAFAQTGPTKPRACAATTVTTGGTAVIVLSGPANGAFVSNPSNASGQGISAAENLYVDMVGTPGSTDATANGTTQALAAGQSFSVPPLAAGISVEVNAATSGHLVSCERW